MQRFVIPVEVVYFHLVTNEFPVRELNVVASLSLNGFRVPIDIFEIPAASSF